MYIERAIRVHVQSCILFPDDKTDTTVHFVASVYFGNPSSINSVQSKKMNKVDPAKIY